MLRTERERRGPSGLKSLDLEKNAFVDVTFQTPKRLVPTPPGFVVAVDTVLFWFFRGGGGRHEINVFIFNFNCMLLV